MSAPEDLSKFSLLDLFRAEIESQSATMTQAIARAGTRSRGSSPFRRGDAWGARSKGAARIVNRESAVRVAHAMEDALVAAQRRGIGCGRNGSMSSFLGIDLLRSGCQCARAGARQLGGAAPGGNGCVLCTLAKPTSVIPGRTKPGQ